MQVKCDGFWRPNRCPLHSTRKKTPNLNLRCTTPGIRQVVMRVSLDRSKNGRILEEGVKLVKNGEVEVETEKRNILSYPTHAFIGVDLATEGVTTEKRMKVREIAAIHFASGNVFHSYVDSEQDKNMSTKRESAHDESIKSDTVNCESINSVNCEIALPWEEVWSNFESWVDGEVEGKTVVLVAHNGVRFDFPIIIKRCEFEMNDSWYYLDSYLLANKLKSRGLIQGRLKLNTLRKSFGIESSRSSNRSVRDVIESGWVLRHLLTLEGTDPEKSIEQLISHETYYFQPLRTLITRSRNTINSSINAPLTSLDTSVTTSNKSTTKSNAFDVASKSSGGSHLASSIVPRSRSENIVSDDEDTAAKLADKIESLTLESDQTKEFSESHDEQILDEIMELLKAQGLPSFDEFEI
eukprot:g8811.t1